MNSSPYLMSVEHLNEQVVKCGKRHLNHRVRVHKKHNVYDNEGYQAMMPNIRSTQTWPYMKQAPNMTRWTILKIMPQANTRQATRWTPAGLQDFQVPRRKGEDRSNSKSGHADRSRRVMMQVPDTLSLSLTGASKVTPRRQFHIRSLDRCILWNIPSLTPRSQVSIFLKSLVSVCHHKGLWITHVSHEGLVLNSIRHPAFLHIVFRDRRMPTTIPDISTSTWLIPLKFTAKGRRARRAFLWSASLIRHFQISFYLDLYARVSLDVFSFQVRKKITQFQNICSLCTKHITALTKTHFRHLS